jgi:NADH dehydrogenase [ubiquinone] 1 alpha subcomplex assembly factor 5
VSVLAMGVGVAAGRFAHSNAACDNCQMNSASSSDMLVFDRAALRRHRDRMASRLPLHDFLHAEVAARLADRLADVQRDFRSVLLIGGSGFEDVIFPRRPERLVVGDIAPRRIAEGTRHAVVFDEEALPFAPGSFDLVVSLLTLHWVNDLPGALIQINRALAPDGLFLGTLLGAGTLDELRVAWMKAELEVHGGASPRVSPFADVRSLGGLLQRAGFALPVVDGDAITATYGDPIRLMREIRGMGEANALLGRAKSFTRRETLFRMAELYRDEFADGDGRIPARFELVTLTGWAPDASQPKPLKPGSARMSLAEVLTPKTDKREPF